MTEGGSAQRPDTDVDRLLPLYQQGDAAAAAALVRAVSPGLARFCLSQGDSPQDLADILQEIWLRVHRARHTFRTGAPALPWLYAVARYARLDAHRRRRRFRSRELQTEALPDVAAPGPEPQPAAITGMLAALPPAQREVLVLLKGCEMTLEEVARATSCTIGAVKQKAHRAYTRLRKMINEERRGRL